jgi:hypothetical protein
MRDRLNIIWWEFDGHYPFRRRDEGTKGTKGTIWTGRFCFRASPYKTFFIL